MISLYIWVYTVICDFLLFVCSQLAVIVMIFRWWNQHQMMSNGTSFACWTQYMTCTCTKWHIIPSYIIIIMCVRVCVFVYVKFYMLCFVLLYALVIIIVKRSTAQHGKQSFSTLLLCLVLGGGVYSVHGNSHIYYILYIVYLIGVCHYCYYDGHDYDYLWWIK